jgi:hypothetical protein
MEPHHQECEACDRYTVEAASGHVSASRAWKVSGRGSVGACTLPAQSVGAIAIRLADAVDGEFRYGRLDRRDVGGPEWATGYNLRASGPPPTPGILSDIMG